MARNIKRRDALKGIGAAGIAGLAGCVGNITGGGGRTIKYGVLLPTSGDLASVGKPMTNAAELPGKILKDADISQKLDWESKDTGTSSQTGISAANDLVNAGYPGVTGPASSGVNIPVSKQVFIKNEVVGCSPSSTAPTVTNLKDNGYIFRTAPSDALQGKVLAQIAAKRVNAKTASTMYVNNDYGQLLSQAFVKNFKNNGGSVQKQVAFEKQQSSYTSKLQSALEKDPDTLIVIGYPASGIQIFKDYYADYSHDKPILLTDGMQDPKLAKQVGEDMTNVQGSAPKPAGPNHDAFVKAYKKEYNNDPGIFTAHSFDASSVLILANAMGGKNEGKSVRDNMKKVANPGGKKIGPNNLADGVKAAANGDDVNYQGASSSVDFDDNGDMKAVSYSVWTFTKDAKVKVTDTIKFS